MPQIELIATAAFGIEAVVARELTALGLTDHTVENGRVIVRCDLDAIPQANLWLRSADRVLLKIGSFKAVTFDELFEKTKALPWADWLPRDANFPVTGKSVKSQLHSVPDCQAIVKKAVVESLRRQYKCAWFEETGPLYRIEVALLKDEVTLTIDTSGSGLHRRGYRPLVGAAPLRETLAAAMIMLSYWNKDRALLDPLCGTGTIPIEAAMIGANMAPGLRRRFAAETWPILPQQLWQNARAQAQESIGDLKDLRIFGSDIDGEALGLARHHAELAGVSEAVRFQKLPVAEVRSRFKYGCVICNPPYGERIGDRKSAGAIYQDMKDAFARLDSWSFYILTSHPNFERVFDQKATRRRKLYNGRIEVTYYQFIGPKPPATVPHLAP
ncbi:MAG TPA: class I SAM-dependent RNA methyltransferase [Firmicutes bacterium]|jgi:putative N6-adenine-specific DNA methylase|nr:class I SAM-dependent RNA methyltransferase [Bacillota bacterium]